MAQTNGPLCIEWLASICPTFVRKGKTMHYAKFLCTAALVIAGTAAQAQAPKHLGATDAEAAQAIQQLCASEWPTSNAALQNHCIDKQTEARAKALQFEPTTSQAKTRIWSRCERDWTSKQGLLDWVMMARCLDFQAQAYKE